MDVADGFLELVWENGQILTRGRSSSLSCISFSSPDTRSVTTGGDINPQKRPRLGTVDSVYGLLGGENFAIKDRLLQDDHPEFNRVMETSRNRGHDKCIDYSWIVPVCQGEGFRPIDAFQEEIPPLMKARTDKIQEQSSLQQSQVSGWFNRSVMNGSQNLAMSQLHNANSQQLKSSGPDKHSSLRQLSLFSRPGIVHPGDQNQGATWPGGVPSTVRDRTLEINKEKTDLENAKESCEYLDPVETEFNQIRRIPSSPKENLPDEHSESPSPVHGNNNRSKRVHDPTSSLEAANIAKRKPDARKLVHQPATCSSICSRGASKKRNDHLDHREMASASEVLPEIANADGEEYIQKPALARAGAEKRRAPEVHNLSERKGRDKINKKMRDLQALIPNSSKVDQASLLDMAIDYLKTLQLQHKIMSMGSNLYMPPMLVPPAMQQIQASQMAHFSAMMRMRMGMNPFPFPNAAAIPGLATVARMPPMGAPITSHPPFVPLVGGSCSPSFPPLPGEFTGSNNTLFSFKPRNPES